MPNFDVRHYHETRVPADPAAAYAALRNLDLERSPTVRLLFAIRNLPSRIRAPERAPARTGESRSFLDSMLDLGWVILEEAPGQELVAGAVTQPWAVTVIFRSLLPAEFPAFSEPGFTKIVWNIAAQADGAGGTLVSTETRVLATDAESRRRFHRYWFLFSPGIRLIRHIALAQARRELARIHRGDAA